MQVFFGRGSPLEPLEIGDQVILVDPRGSRAFCVLATVAASPVERNGRLEFLTDQGETVALGTHDTFYVRRPALCRKGLAGGDRA